jgi:hypothetical protein
MYCDISLAKASEKDIKQVNKHLLTEKKQSKREKGMRNEKKVPFSLHFIATMAESQTSISKKIDIYIT